MTADSTHRRPSPPRARRLAGIGLVAVCLFDLWWRGHTIGPTVRDLVGFAPYPIVAGQAEPVDCDEAAYAYIGQGLAHGRVMYRDLSENKPPLGYWLYALTIRLGGMNELTIRLMPLVPVLATIALVWWVGLRRRGGTAGTLAAFVFALLSTDPYLYGNGANLEHFLNLFGMVGLAALVRAWDEPNPRARRGWIALAGAGVALGFLVKQVAALAGPVFALALLLAPPPPGTARARRVLGDWLTLLGGFAIPCLIAAGILLVQGAGPDAWADIVEYGSALATLKVPDPGAPPRLVRWLTGNAAPWDYRPARPARADLLGWWPPGARPPWLINLPPPFGRTDYLVWWGLGAWPTWLASVPATAWYLLRRRSSPRDRLVAAWTAAAWVQVALPGLFWQHYYLLPTPGVALVLALATADTWAAAVASIRAWRLGVGLMTGLAGLALLGAIGATAWIQVRDYLLVPTEQLTVRYKGGAQWVALREFGRDLKRRAAVWGDRPPELYIWGWQSPLHFYGGLNSPTRHFFGDPLLEDYANGHHRDDPRVRPRVDRIARDLAAHPPGLVLVARPPFAALRTFLREHGYRRTPFGGLNPASPDGRGLYIDPEHLHAFERAGGR